MPFEHYDSVRTHFVRAGAFWWLVWRQGLSRRPDCTRHLSDGVGHRLPEPRRDIPLWGRYGNVPNATGAFVAKVDQTRSREPEMQVGSFQLVFRINN